MIYTFYTSKLNQAEKTSLHIAAKEMDEMQGEMQAQGEPVHFRFKII